MTMSDDPLISLENVEVQFENGPDLLDISGKTETVRAVDDVSFTIEERDVVLLVGESGCGKTAIGLQRPRCLTPRRDDGSDA